MKIFLPCHTFIRFINVILILALPFILTGQVNADLWRPISENDIPDSGVRYIIPEQYQTWVLDLMVLREKLNQAPFTGSNDVKVKPAFLDIPWPDGSIKTFQIIESPIMEKGLMEKFPQIKTYVGSEVSDPSKYIRFDFTPKGFHGMILTAGEGTVYIDPYSYGGGDIHHYISYYKKDFTPVSGKEMICGVNGSAVNKEDFKPSGMGTAFGSCELRTYRLALAATGEYTQFHGGTVGAALSAQVTTMNRVNGVYERDLAIRMNIIANNNLIIYTNSSSDPYSNNNGGTMLGQNQTNIDAVIGSSNYDIGHVFSTGGGGIAQLYSPCTSNKARGVTGSFAPVGDPFDIDYVCHEMGHQFGGNHTQNNNCQRNNATAMEPGSASSIMGYAGICPPNVQSNSDDHFHGISLQEIGAFVTSSFHTCPTKTTLSNNAPTVTGTNGAGVTIPGSTPFALTAIATDPDANTLTYCWEQMNNGTSYPMPPSSSSTGGPNFRSFSPSTSPTRYFPNLPDVLAGSSPTWEVLSSVSRTMNFRVSVRDNAFGGGCTDHDDITISIDGSSGPFIVTYPSNTGIAWTGNSSEIVTWNVAGSDVAPVSCASVDILLSTDGGLTYPTVLATSVTNDGSQAVTVPNVGTATARIMVICSNGTFFDVSNNNFSINVATCNVTTSLNGNVSCNGLADGSATANATGVSPFIYVWNNGQASATATGLSAGTYTVTVTDGVACVSSASVVISEPSLINISSTSSTDETCVNNDGTATVVAIGGTGTLNYSWDALANNQVTNVATGLTANTYSVTVTDNNGCSVSTSVFVADGCCALTVNASGSNLICNGDNNGTVTVTPNGTAPYSYQWTGGQNTQTATGLSAGIYTVTVTDASPCTVTAIVTVTEPLPITTSISTVAESCLGNDGSATITTSGSSGTLSFLWDPAANSQTTATANALSSGSYNYTVTDANGCLGIGIANILDGCLTGCDTISNINFSTDTVRFYLASAGPPATFVAGHNQYGDLAKADYFNYSGLNTHVQGVYLGFGMAAASNSTNTFNVIILDGTGGIPGATLGTTTLRYQTVADSIAAGTYIQYVPLGNISLPASNEFFVGISFTYGADSIALLTNTIGETTPNTAWEQWGDLSWYAYSDPTGWNFDLAHYIIPLLGVPPTTGFTQNNTSVCTGGTISYTNTTVNGQSYQWLFPGGTPSSSTAINPSVTYNTAGNYDVTLIATNECISDTITISNTAVITDLTVNVNTISESCVGSDGSATITGSGGLAPYTYQWDVIAGSQSTATATGLNASGYSYTVTDANGCTGIGVANVGNGCLTGCDSISNINFSTDTVRFYLASAGPPATFVAGHNQYGDLAKADYFNYSGLNSHIQGVFLGFGRAAASNSTNTFNVIVLDGAGGVPGATLGTTTLRYQTVADSIAAGTYIQYVPLGNISLPASNEFFVGISFTYGADSIALLTNTIGETTPNTAWEQWGDLSWYAYSDPTGWNFDLAHYIVPLLGTLPTTGFTQSNTSVCTGGTIAYTNTTINGQSYEWAFPGGTPSTSTATNPSVTYNSAGTYDVTLIATNECISDTIISSNSIVVGALGVNASTGATSCNGTTDGSSTVTLSGGTPPYSYLWNASANNQTTSTATGLSAGTYFVTVIDATGCAEVTTTTISEPSVLSVNVNVDNHVLCYNGSDGQLTAVATGGTGAYIYSWSNGQNSSTINGLNANIYSLTVSDANGCIFNSSATINEPSSALNAVVGTVINPQCNGASTGTIIINASGGTPNYTYNLGSGNQSSNTLSGLSAGSYSITVTDANSCTDIVNATLTNPSGMTVSAAVTSNYNGADISCNGASDGSVSANVSGGLGPYTYLWSPGGQTSQAAIGLNAGLYTVTVTDANNCDVFVNVTLVEPSALYLTTIDNGNGSASTIAFSGTSPYTFFWDASANSQTTATATGLVHNNTYTVTVTDANGCTISSSVTINIVGLENVSELSMFEVVPNPNAGHFEIRFSFIRPEDVNIKLINVLGQILYELNCFEESYSVSIDLQHQASGVYFVVLKTNNQSITRKVVVSK
ncbi:M12 family metallo-peptidase [Aureispira]|nr:M12 family metallo-peptidase [Aureispira sp.]